jgi:hypothetical protein
MKNIDDFTISEIIFFDDLDQKFKLYFENQSEYSIKKRSHELDELTKELSKFLKETGGNTLIAKEMKNYIINQDQKIMSKFEGLNDLLVACKENHNVQKNKEIIPMLIDVFHKVSESCKLKTI